MGLVASARGYNQVTALKMLHQDATRAGFCVNKCTEAELISYAIAKANEAHVRKSTGVILKALAGRQMPESEQVMINLQAASRIAVALGQSPTALYRQASSEAVATKMCTHASGKR